MVRYGSNLKQFSYFMRDLFVHIGAHKTGTTAVQQTLSTSRSELMRCGVTYPKINWYHYSQHRLAFAMKGISDPERGDTPRLDREVAKLNDAIAGAETDKILISSEELFSAKISQIAQFAELLEGVKVHVIGFVRRPDTFLISMYNQKAKHPGNRFQRGINAFVADPYAIDADISFYTCFRNWASVFGLSQLHLCTYEAGDPLAQILRIVGLAPDVLSMSGPRINQSVPGAVIEIMRLSKLIGMHPEKQAALYKLAVDQFASYPSFSLSNADRRAILEALEPETSELFSAFGRENPYLVSNVELAPENDAPQQNLRLRDMMALVDRLL